MENQKTKLIKRQDVFKITIPEHVEDKIKFVCNRIYDREWSGILFYTPKGDFENNTLNIICNDIFIMDIGSCATTEFEMSPEVVAYMTENPKLMDCQVGLIHSHHTMPTWFSGTDLGTLLEEGLCRNHFVSLIVNNEGIYSAAITRRITSQKQIKENFNYSSFENITKTGSSVYDINEDYVEYFPLEILKKAKDNTDNILKSRIEELKNRKRQVKENTAKPFELSMFSDNNYKNNNTNKKDFPVLEGLNTHTFLSYEDVKINPDKIRTALLQLLTGSILVDSNSKLEIDKWVKGMPSLYRKRFGEGKEGMSLFKGWAELYTEFICWYSEDSELLKTFDMEEVAAIYAYNLVQKLDKLPQNEYIKTFITVLENYIL